MLDILLKRKSIRSYTGENISEEELKMILDACECSPVGMKQYESLHLTVISNAELLKEIDEATGKLFGKPDIHPLYGAPTFIIISSKKFSPGMENVMYSNAAIMSHNIALQAAALNIGSCYIWAAIAAISNNQEIINKLNLPDDFVPCCGVILGKTIEVYEEREITEKISKSFIK